MKKLSNIFFVALLGFVFFNFFIKNSAEADAKKSYDDYLAGKAIIIDVREEQEVKEGMIKGAHWIPLSRIEKETKTEIIKIKELAKDKSIFLYCRSGRRSGMAKGYLEESGITAINLGGMSDLVNENIPTQPSPQ